MNSLKMYYLLLHINNNIIFLDAWKSKGIIVDRPVDFEEAISLTGMLFIYFFLFYLFDLLKLR